MGNVKIRGDTAPKTWKTRSSPPKMNALLIVTTSHRQLGTTGRKTGMWLEEFVGVYRRFRDIGVAVVVASPRGGEVPLVPLSVADQLDRIGEAEAAEDDFLPLRIDEFVSLDFDPSAPGRAAGGQGEREKRNGKNCKILAFHNVVLIVPNPKITKMSVGFHLYFNCFQLSFIARSAHTTRGRGVGNVGGNAYLRSNNKTKSI